MRERPWHCPHCRTILGWLCYRRQQRPSLRLANAQVEETDGVLLVTCPTCGTVARWVVRKARVA